MFTHTRIRSLAVATWVVPFRVTAAASQGQAIRFTMAYSFRRASGAGPAAAVTMTPSGLFGTTTAGGGSGGGTVYGLGPGPLPGTYIASAIVAFPSGWSPWDTLLMGLNGSLYGTTKNGGMFGYGTVFMTTPAGALTVLHSLNGASDGCEPLAGLVQDSAGDLFGACQSCGPNGTGTIFEFTASVTYISITRLRRAG